jgi:hypothetical protein
LCTTNSKGLYIPAKQKIAVRVTLIGYALAFLCIIFALGFVSSNSVLAVSACPGIGVSGPLLAIVPAGTTTSFVYNVSFAGFALPSTVTLTTSSAPTGWSWSIVPPTSFIASGTGYHLVTVHVSSSTFVGSQASLTLTATDGTCANSVTTAAHTTGLATTPEFGLGMVVALGLGMFTILLAKRQSLHLPMAGQAS